MTGKVLEHNDRKVLLGLLMKQVRMLKKMVATKDDSAHGHGKRASDQEVSFGYIETDC
jgi:hypothetical protein